MHNALYSEVDAMVECGLSPEQWYDLDRDERIMLMAYVSGKKLTGILVQYDMAEDRRAENERQARMRQANKRNR